MAKQTRTLNFKNAVIDYQNMSITEINKDNEEEFSLNEVFKEWDGIEGISLTLKQDSSPIFSDKEDDEEEGA